MKCIGCGKKFIQIGDELRCTDCVEEGFHAVYNAARFGAVFINQAGELFMKPQQVDENDSPVDCLIDLQDGTIKHYSRIDCSQMFLATKGENFI